MGLIRQAGFKEIAATVRDASHDDDLLLAILRTSLMNSANCFFHSPGPYGVPDSG
jgi:hypothetical protein